MRFVVTSGTGTGFSPSTPVSPVSIIPPMLHTHLHVALSRNTSGPSLGNFQKSKALWGIRGALDRRVLSRHAFEGLNKMRVVLENRDQHFTGIFSLCVTCFPYFLDYSSSFSNFPPQPPSANQPTVRMQALYISIATPPCVLCISIVLEKQDGDA
jgi:hypothetical protein